MTQFLFPLLLTVLLLGIPFLASAKAAAPPLMLAKVYQSIDAFNLYIVTEKFDGVRGYWTGAELLSRSGYKLEIPSWFEAQLPSFPVEGEIWLGYGRFAELSGLLKRNDVSDELWSEVVFKVFDAPNRPGSYQQRMAWLKDVLLDSQNMQLIGGFEVGSQSELDDALQAVIDRGGEGLMLNLITADYQSSRTGALLKVKPVEDDEAKVIGYTAGKGKYEGQVGALIVEWRDGRTFKVGSGLSDELRLVPPAIGSIITFEFSGYTSTGLPRFARYLRPYVEH